jgi:hypothetical protein
LLLSQLHVELAALRVPSALLQAAAAALERRLKDPVGQWGNHPAAVEVCRLAAVGFDCLRLLLPRLLQQQLLQLQ